MTDKKKLYFLKITLNRIAGFVLTNNAIMWGIFGPIFSLIKERRICLSVIAGNMTPK